MSPCQRSWGGVPHHQPHCERSGSAIATRGEVRQRHGNQHRCVAQKEYENTYICLSVSLLINTHTYMYVCGFLSFLSSISLVGRCTCTYIDCLSTSVSTFSSTPTCIFLSVCLSVCPSIHVSLCLSMCLSVCLSVCLLISLSLCLSSRRELDRALPSTNQLSFACLSEI